MLRGEVASKFYKAVASRPLFVGILGISLLRLWVVSEQRVNLISHAGYDDALFLLQGISLSSFRWLSQHNENTHIKGMVYPLFLALSFYASLPVLLSQHLVYLSTGMVWVRLLKRLGCRTYALLIFYSVFAFNPASASGSSVRAIRDYFYASLSLLVLAGIFEVLLDWKEKKERKLPGILLGIVFSLFWFTREEGIWILPSLAILITMGGVYYVSRKRKNIKLYLVPLLCALFVFLSAQLVIRTLNYIGYGLWITTEMHAGYFKKAYGSLTRVKPETPRQYVPFSKDVRQKIYQVSPAFLELKPFLEEKGWIEAGCGHISPCDDLSSHALFAFRDAVKKAGYYRPSGGVETYYQRLTNEISAACDRGKLDCYPPRNTLVPVLIPGVYGGLIKSFFSEISFVSKFGECEPAVPEPPVGYPTFIAFFSKFLHSENLNPVENSDKVWERSPVGKVTDFKFNVLRTARLVYSYLFPWLGAAAFLVLMFRLLQYFFKRRPLTWLEACNIVVLLAFVSRCGVITFVHVTGFFAINGTYNQCNYALFIVFVLLGLLPAFPNSSMSITLKK